MTTPETRLSGFIAYATSRPSGRAAAVRQAIGGDYRVEQDFYLRMRRAVEADRAGARDGEAIAAAVRNATPKKVRRFAALGKNWPKVSARWDDCTAAEVERASVTIAGLTVSLSASFAERHPDGTLEIVMMGYSAPEAAADLDMVLRVVQRAYSPLYPDANITYVDLGRGRVRTTVGRDLRHHDMRIDTDAAGLAYALRMAAA